MISIEQIDRQYIESGSKPKRKVQEKKRAEPISTEKFPTKTEFLPLKPAQTHTSQRMKDPTLPKQQNTRRRFHSDTTYFRGGGRAAQTFRAGPTIFFKEQGKKQSTGLGTPVFHGQCTQQCQGEGTWRGVTDFVSSNGHEKHKKHACRCKNLVSWSLTRARGSQRALIGEHAERPIVRAQKAPHTAVDDTNTAARLEDGAAAVGNIVPDGRPTGAVTIMTTAKRRRHRVTVQAVHASMAATVVLVRVVVVAVVSVSVEAVAVVRVVVLASRIGDAEAALLLVGRREELAAAPVAGVLLLVIVVLRGGRFPLHVPAADGEICCNAMKGKKNKKNSRLTFDRTRRGSALRQSCGTDQVAPFNGSDFWVVLYSAHSAASRPKNIFIPWRIMLFSNRTIAMKREEELKD